MEKPFFNFDGFAPRESHDTDPNLFLRFLKNLGRNIKATGVYFLIGVLLSARLGNGKNIVYVNVMNNLSVDCDCDGNPAKPKMKDIGILASTDPVALDQACIDLVYSAEDGESLVERIELRNGFHALEYAQEIGLGSCNYELKNIDEK